jgi:hypothetical protein
MPDEEIYKALVKVDFDIVSVKQLSSNCRSHTEGDPKLTKLLLFLIALSRTQKSQEISTLTVRCHVSIKVEAYKIHKATTVTSLVMSELIAPSLPIACGVGAATCTRNAQKRETSLPLHHAATVSWWRVKILILPAIGATAARRTRSVEEDCMQNPGPQQEGCSLLLTPRRVCPLLQHQATRRRNHSSPRHARLQWQLKAQGYKRRHLPLRSRKKVSQFWLPV